MNNNDFYIVLFFFWGNIWQHSGCISGSVFKITSGKTWGTKWGASVQIRIGHIQSKHLPPKQLFLTLLTSMFLFETVWCRAVQGINHRVFGSWSACLWSSVSFQIRALSAINLHEAVCEVWDQKKRVSAALVTGSSSLRDALSRVTTNTLCTSFSGHISGFLKINPWFTRWVYFRDDAMACVFTIFYLACLCGSVPHGMVASQ